MCHKATTIRAHTDRQEDREGLGNRFPEHDCTLDLHWTLVHVICSAELPSANACDIYSSSSCSRSRIKIINRDTCKISQLLLHFTGCPSTSPSTTSQPTIAAVCIRWPRVAIAGNIIIGLLGEVTALLGAEQRERVVNDTANNNYSWSPT